MKIKKLFILSYYRRRYFASSLKTGEGALPKQNWSGQSLSRSAKVLRWIVSSKRRRMRQGRQGRLKKTKEGWRRPKKTGEDWGRLKETEEDWIMLERTEEDRRRLKKTEEDQRRPKKTEEDWRRLKKAEENWGRLKKTGEDWNPLAPRVETPTAVSPNLWGQYFIPNFVSLGLKKIKGWTLMK